ncbi:MAG TPA: ABC transporter substrate-binding protein [Methylomirabilota bacterium]|nr:ABC transporter substrate-binding protein [Methylomirabilota bacterium]
MRPNLKDLTVRTLAVALAIASGAVPALASAADRPLQKINVAYSSISGNIAPLWVTQDKGFFRKYGLEVQAILIESGTTTAQALVAGDISFASVAGPAAIQSHLRGADIVIIAGIINTLTFQLYTEKGITRPDQFKGKSVAVTRYGSATDFAMRYALDKYGLDANKDVAILQLGNQPAQLAALEAGKIQGAMLSMPTSLKAKKMGFPMLADLQMLGLEYQHTSIATTRSLMKSKPDLVRDFLRAYIEGIHYAKTHRKETLDVLAKYLRTDDKDVLDETYESIVATLVPEKPYPTLKGIQIILRELGVKDAAARNARAEQFVDTSVIKELDSSGFIDRLYKSTAVAKASQARPEPPAAQPPAVKTQFADAKTKPAASEDKARPVAKPVPTTSDKALASAPVAKQGAQQYIVKPGDTLSKLAGQFYSAPYKWDKIYQANRDVLKNPDYIYIGMKLVIPALEENPS